MSAPARPSPGTARPYEFPAVHRHALANGLPLSERIAPGSPYCSKTLSNAARASPSPVPRKARTSRRKRLKLSLIVSGSQRSRSRVFHQPL